jgi:hypothetical protein
MSNLSRPRQKRNKTVPTLNMFDDDNYDEQQQEDDEYVLFSNDLAAHNERHCKRRRVADAMLQTAREQNEMLRAVNDDLRLENDELRAENDVLRAQVIDIEDWFNIAIEQCKQMHNRYELMVSKYSLLQHQYNQLLEVWRDSASQMDCTVAKHAAIAICNQMVKDHDDDTSASATDRPETKLEPLVESRAPYVDNLTTITQ